MSEQIPAVGFLENLGDDVRARLASAGTFQQLTAGQHLIDEGDEQELLFLILDGVFDVFTKQKGARTAVGTLMVGGSIGEINIFNPSAASADVVSRGDGKVWALDRAGLNSFVEGNPREGNKVLVGLLTMMSERMRVMNTKLAESEQWGDMR